MTRIWHSITKSTGRKGAAMLLVLLVGLGVFGTVGLVSAIDKPGMTVVASPTSQTLTQGTAGSVTYLIEITRTGGFTDAVDLSVTGLPKDVTAAWSKSHLEPTDTESILTLTSTAATKEANLNLKIKAQSSSKKPDVRGDADVALEIAKANKPNFYVALTPGARSGVVGDTFTYQVKITRTGGFTGAINLTPDGPPHSTTTISPATLAVGQTMATVTVDTMPNTPKGDQRVKVKGKATDVGGEPSSSAILTLTKPNDFRITGDLGSALHLDAPLPLDLEITNNFTKDLTISQIHAEVTSVDKPLCDAAQNFEIANLASNYSVVVPSGATRKLSTLGTHAMPTVRWVNKPFAQNACLGATLHFAYTAHGVSN